MDANDFFDNSDGGGKQQILRQNQFGGDIGGPIKKNKIFHLWQLPGNPPAQRSGGRGRQLDF